MNKRIYDVIRKFYAFTVAMGIGTVTNLVLFFGFAFLFAGPDGEEWVRFYMDGNGEYFITVSIILAMGVYPFVKNLNIVLNDK